MSHNRVSCVHGCKNGQDRGDYGGRSQEKIQVREHKTRTQTDSSSVILINDKKIEYHSTLHLPD